jgi:hypothetical protein
MVMRENVAKLAGWSSWWPVLAVGSVPALASIPVAICHGLPGGHLPWPEREAYAQSLGWRVWPYEACVGALLVLLAEFVVLRSPARLSLSRLIILYVTTLGAGAAGSGALCLLAGPLLELLPRGPVGDAVALMCSWAIFLGSYAALGLLWFVGLPCLASPKLREPSRGTGIWLVLAGGLGIIVAHWTVTVATEFGTALNPIIDAQLRGAWFSWPAALAGRHMSRRLGI